MTQDSGGPQQSTERSRASASTTKTTRTRSPAPVRPERVTNRGHVAWQGVIGELLITAGVLLFAFLAWQLWWTDVQGNHAQAAIVKDLGWGTVPLPGDATTLQRRHDDPPVADLPAHATTFATLLVPRWGSDYQRPISEGVDRATVLNPRGIGHYPGTVMPGGVGNFSVAGHRTTYGEPFNLIADLVVGDPLVVRTQKAWYVYRVTSTEIVPSSDIGVVAAVPGQADAAPTERMITLTTCHPMYSAKERYIVHGVLDYWTPAGGPIPTEVLGGA